MMVQMRRRVRLLTVIALLLLAVTLVMQMVAARRHMFGQTGSRAAVGMTAVEAAHARRVLDSVADIPSSARTDGLQSTVCPSSELSGDQYVERGDTDMAALRSAASAPALDVATEAADVDMASDTAVKGARRVANVEREKTEIEKNSHDAAARRLPTRAVEPTAPDQVLLSEPDTELGFRFDPFERGSSDLHFSVAPDAAGKPCWISVHGPNADKCTLNGLPMQAGQQYEVRPGMVLNAPGPVGVHLRPTAITPAADDATG